MDKDKSLDGLRGIAALTVVLAHAFYAYFPYLTTRRMPFEGLGPKTIVDATLYQIPFNYLFIADAAVVVFFTLSGYVLTMKFFRYRRTEDIQSAATRRYIRLIFPAAASVLFAWVILYLGLMYNDKVGVIDVSGWPIGYYGEQRNLLNAVFTGFVYVPLFGDSYFNGPLWSIQIEFLGSMSLFLSFALFGRVNLLLVSLVFVYIAKLFCGVSPNILYYLAILSGSMLHTVTDYLKRLPWLSVFLFTIGLVLLSVDNSPQYQWLRGLPVPNLAPLIADFSQNKVLFWQTIGSVLVVAGVIGNPTIARILGSRIPAYLGKLSFATYLLHMPLIMSLMLGSMYGLKLVGAKYLVQIGVSFVLFFVVLIWLSHLFEKYIDQPSIRLAWKFDSWLIQRHTK